VESDDDVRALAVFMDAIEQAADQFDTDRIVDSIITAVDNVRLTGVPPTT
jgi:hypothetical protein